MTNGPVPLVGALSFADALLEAALGDPQVDDLDDVARLELLGSALRLATRVDAVTKMLVAEADRHGSTRQLHGVSTSGWLRETGALSQRQANALVMESIRLSGLPAIWRAQADGMVSARQSEAMVSTLRRLPPHLDERQLAAAEDLLVENAAHQDPGELRGLGPEIVMSVDPDHGELLLEQQTERQERMARQNRELRFHADGQGSVRIRGQLPVAEAEQVWAAVDALAEQLREQRDPGETFCSASCAGTTCPICGGQPSSAMLRADALVQLVVTAVDANAIPAMGGDRPRVQITLPFEALTRGVGVTDLGGQLISARQARLLACDADILPAVLDSAGVPLDVGTTRRLFTAELRAALVIRDGGCVFPGCERPPRSCEGHHVVPWWAGGSTSLDNGMLLCRHHHALVEPSRDRLHNDRRWQARIGEDGLPEFLPPISLDPDRVPRRHARHRRTLSIPAEGAGPAP